MCISLLYLGSDDHSPHFIGAAVFLLLALVAMILMILRWRGLGPMLRWRLFNLRIGWAGYCAIAVACVVLAFVSIDPKRDTPPHAVAWMLCLACAFLFGIVGDLIATHGKPSEDNSAMNGLTSIERETKNTDTKT